MSNQPAQSHHEAPPIVAAASSATEPTLSPPSKGRGPGGRLSSVGSGAAALPGVKKAHLFYAWEFGANLGHIGTFLPVARVLRERGHEVHWIVTHPHQAAQLLPREDFVWLQAPTMRETPREDQPLNYADILLRFGYARREDLLGLTVAWRELMRLTGARIVLADHAPTAILAARSLDIPVMLFGGGFFAPPSLDPTPNMRPWAPVPLERLAQLDALALDNINAVLALFGKPPLDFVAELFQVTETSLLTFPELDHYAARGPAKYWGTLPAAVAEPPHWPDVPGPRVFAYLRPESAHFEAALEALKNLNGSVLIFAPGIPEALRAGYVAPHLHFAPEPVDLTTVAAQADAAVTYASPAATIAFLMAGKPALMLPGHLEQFLFARRVEEMGAGLLLNPGHASQPLAEMLGRVLSEPALRDNAAAFARKYANFDQTQVMTHIVHRIEDILQDADRNNTGAGTS